VRRPQADGRRGAALRDACRGAGRQHVHGRALLELRAHLTISAVATGRLAAWAAIAGLLLYAIVGPGSTGFGLTFVGYRIFSLAATVAVLASWLIIARRRPEWR